MPELTEEQRKYLHEIAIMPAGQRYDLFIKMALEGFVITITLRTDETGHLVESINLQTAAEAGPPEP